MEEVLRFLKQEKENAVPQCRITRNTKIVPNVKAVIMQNDIVQKMLITLMLKLVKVTLNSLSADR